MTVTTAPPDPSPLPTSPAAAPTPKVTRRELAAHLHLCVRLIDRLTAERALPHYRFGKSIRYDLAEVEAALRGRFHVPALASATLTHAQSS